MYWCSRETFAPIITMEAQEMEAAVVFEMLVNFLLGWIVTYTWSQQSS